MDDFVSWDNLAGWWPRLEEQVLSPLLAGQNVTYQQRDWTNDPRGHQLSAWRILPWRPVVILEGVTSSRQSIADRLTLAVWIDAPRSLRLQRGVARDGEDRRHTWTDWMQREDDFFAKDRTRRRADLLVDGAPTTPHSPADEFICHPNNHRCQP
jgi:uridine kinase